MKNNRAVGADYEQKAAQYLETLGYRILERNFRCRMGEIDLIAMEGRYLVFLEVKYRTDLRTGTPQEAVNDRKQKKICRAASYYCKIRRISTEQPCRFDVAACRAEEWTLIRNAFDYRE
ncbi:MAG: YraN family protein [Eubacterium sp.]|nr:YraN family protein [Eubacterium sp.]